MGIRIIHKVFHKTPKNPPESTRLREVPLPPPIVVEDTGGRLTRSPVMKALKSTRKR